MDSCQHASDSGDVDFKWITRCRDNVHEVKNYMTSANNAMKYAGTSPKGDSKKHIKKHVVINELLCFVVNNIYTLTRGTVERICTKYFDEAEINDARIIIREAAQMNWTNIRNKTCDYMCDICDVLYGTELDDLPIFVALDLSKLPVIEYDRQNASKLLCEKTVTSSVKDLIKSESESDVEPRNVNCKPDMQDLRKEIICAVKGEMLKMRCQIMEDVSKVVANVAEKDNNDSSNENVKPTKKKGDVDSTNVAACTRFEDQLFNDNCSNSALQNTIPEDLTTSNCIPMPDSHIRDTFIGLRQMSRR